MLKAGEKPGPNVCEVCGREMEIAVTSTMELMNGETSEFYGHVHTPAQCSLNLMSDIRDQLRDVLLELGEIYRRL